MERVYTLGRMEENMMESINMIRSMDSVFILGQMDEGTKGNG